MPKPTKIYLFTNLFKNFSFDIILHKIALKCKEEKDTFFLHIKIELRKKSYTSKLFFLGFITVEYFCVM
jgi:hypothetical protein